MRITRPPATPVVLALALVACLEPATHAQLRREQGFPALPAIRAQVDLTASELDLAYATPHALPLDDPEFGGELKRELATGIGELFYSQADVVPVRFRLTGSVTVDETSRALYPCFVFGVYFGCDDQRVTTDVTLTMQLGERTHTATGRDQRPYWSMNGGLRGRDIVRDSVARAGFDALRKVAAGLGGAR